MENAPVRVLVISIPGQRVIIERVFLFPGIYWRGMRSGRGEGKREKERESLCRFNILTDESPLAMLRMEIVGPDSAVTARRQIINFSLDAKRIPLSVCSPPPSSVCLPFFASVVSSIGLSLSRCLFDFAKWKNFSRMQEEKLTGGRGSRPCRPFYSNFFLSSLPPPPPRSRIFSQRRTPGRKTPILSHHPYYHPYPTHGIPELRSFRRKN